MILREAQLTRDIETLTEKGQKNLGVIEKEVGRPMKERDNRIMELGKNPVQDFIQDKL